MTDYSPNTDPVLNPTNRKYFLELKIKKISKNAFQGMAGRLKGLKQGYIAILLQLVPSKRQNGQFLYAWQPDIAPEYDEMGNIVKNHPPEVILELQDKPYGVARCFVMRADNDSPDYPYLFLASVGAESDIKKYYSNGDVIRAISLPSTEDNVGDAALNPEADIDLYE